MKFPDCNQSLSNIIFNIRWFLIISFFIIFLIFLFQKNSNANPNLISFFNNNDKSISVLKINYIYNDKPLTLKDYVECEPDFIDDYKIKVKKIIDKKNNYIILQSNVGKVYLESIKCYGHKIPLIYGAQRKKFIDDYGFVAYKDSLNYIGDVTINFKSSLFKITDLLNLSGFINDKKGEILVNVDDKILNCLDYIDKNFNDIYQLKLVKSLLIDPLKLKPNDKPKIYNLEIINDEIQQIQNPKLPPPPNSLVPFQVNNQNLNISKNQIDSIDIYQKNNHPPIGDFPKKYDHPYANIPYSEIYSYQYNPYYSIGNPADPSKNFYNLTQDPIMEKPH